MIDGPKAMQSKTMLLTGGTMTDMRLRDGTWVFYDGPMRREGIDVVHWKECGFVAGAEGVTIAVTETKRYVWAGVL